MRITTPWLPRKPGYSSIYNEKSSLFQAVMTATEDIGANPPADVYRHQGHCQGNARHVPCCENSEGVLSLTPNTDAVTAKGSMGTDSGIPQGLPR